MPASPPTCPDTLKKRAEFLAVAKGARAARRAFVLQALCAANDGRRLGAPRVGYTVTKKTGNAVERNRIRRRMRAAIRAVAPAAARPGCDYVLVGRRPALSISFSELKKDLAASFARVHKDRDRTTGTAAVGDHRSDHPLPVSGTPAPAARGEPPAQPKSR